MREVGSHNKKQKDIDYHQSITIMVRQKEKRPHSGYQKLNAPKSLWEDISEKELQEYINKNTVILWNPYRLCVWDTQPKRTQKI